MSRIQIPYNNAAARLHLDYPASYDVQSITGVTIDVLDLDATDLLAAAGDTGTCTLYTADALGAAASVGDSTITYTTTAMTPGLSYEIAASAAGPAEVFTVQSCNSSTKIVTLTRDLRYAHTNGTAIKGCYCYYDIDTTSTSIYPESEQVVITWTPAGSDNLPYEQRAEIGSRAFGVRNFERRFKLRHPSAYDLVEDRFEDIAVEVIDELGLLLMDRDINLDRVKDTERVASLAFKLMWVYAVADGGNEYEHEQTESRKAFNESFEKYCALPIWQDLDQDDIRDEPEELQTGVHHFGRGM